MKLTLLRSRPAQPVELLKWREAAVFVRADVLRKGYTKSSPYFCTWASYLSNRLQGYNLAFDVDGRVQLYTTTKWIADSHYREARNGCKYDDVHCTFPEDTQTGAPFVRNSGGGVTLDDPVGDASPDLFTFDLTSASPYAPLVSCLRLPPPGERCNQNFAVAQQHACPPMLSLGEFVAFGSLRSSVELQHHNILCALIEDTLMFSEIDVVLLVAQALWQAGEPGSDWHRRADELSFGTSSTVCNGNSRCGRGARGYVCAAVGAAMGDGSGCARRGAVPPRRLPGPLRCWGSPPRDPTAPAVPPHRDSVGAGAV